MDDEDSDEAEKQFRKDLKKIQNLKKKQEANGGAGA
jgi:hypothetical protein